MPLPKPKKGESKVDWDERCMGSDVMRREYPKQKQRYAVCSQIWRDKGKKHSESRPTFGEAYADEAGPLKIPAGACRFELAEGALAMLEPSEEKPHDFRVVVSSGEAMQHWFWGDMAIDLSGVRPRKKKLAVLRDHRGDEIAGWADRFGAEEDGWIAYGQFSQVTDVARETAALLKEGFPWQASMFVTPQRLEQLEKGTKAEVNGFEMKGPAVIWRESVVDEVTFTPVGADRKTSVTALAEEGEAIAFNRNLVTLTQSQHQDTTKEDEQVDQKELKEAVVALTAKELTEIASETVDEIVLEAVKAEREKAWAYFEAFPDDAAYARRAYFEEKDLTGAQVEHAKARATAAEKRAEELKAQLPGEGQTAVPFEADENRRLAGEKPKGQDGESAVTKFEARKAELMGAGKSEGQAIQAIVQENPKLHKAWIDEINAPKV